MDDETTVVATSLSAPVVVAIRWSAMRTPSSSPDSTRNPGPDRAGFWTKPDAEDPNIVNHLNWYEATGFTRPYPGEKTVLHPSEFKVSAAPRVADLDD